MKKLFPGLVVGLTFALLMLAFSTSHAEVPDPNDVAAIAIYRATVDTRDDWPDSLVNYNVTDANLIAEMLSGIEADVERDCSDLKTKNNAYLYIKFKDGTWGVPFVPPLEPLLRCRGTGYLLLR
jgi:hypothetical protein